VVCSRRQWADLKRLQEFMDITEVKSEGLNREFRIAVDAADIDRRITGRLEEIARTIRMPGFRPGKVPVSLLRKRYGPAIRGEILEQAINDTTTSMLADRGLKPATQPRIEIQSFDEGGDLQYTMALEVLPEIEPLDLASLELERVIAEPDEAEVDSTLGRLAAGSRSFAVEEGRAAENGDQVLIDFVGRVDGEAFAGGQAEGYELELGSGRFLPGFEDQLVGAKAGDSRELNIAFPEEYGAAELAGKDAVFEVKVHEVRTPGEAVLDDSLARSFGAESLDDLKSRIREDQGRELKSLSRLRLKRELLDVMADRFSFEVPAGLVENEYVGIVQQLKPPPGSEGDAADDHDHAELHDHDHDYGHDHGHDHDHDHSAARVNDAHLTDAERTEYRGIAERRVRLGLVLADIGQRNELRVGEEEINRAVLAEARRYPGQEQAVVEYFRSNPKAAEGLAAPIYEDKVIDFIVEMAQVTERHVSMADLLKELEPESAGGDAAEGSETPSGDGADQKA